jgi:hypothetical protein
MPDYWLEIFWSIWTFLFGDPHRTTATFTVVLGFSTVFLWLSTRKLWRITRIAAEHIPHVERAYVSGGTPWTDDSLTELRLTINNYGKTPAFVGTVIIGMIEAGTPVPEKPVYAGKGEFAGAVVKPDVTLRFFSITRPCVPDGRVVYGRIYYRDIFNKCHSSGFALRALSGMPAAQAPDAYWEDRDEPDLGPAARREKAELDP